MTRITGLSNLFNLRKITFLALFMGFAGVAMSQGTADIKHETENAGWEYSLETAYAMSKESGKPILANFTGSDWCGWCKRLTKSVFVHKEFKDWAEDNVILLELDFPRRTKLPTELQQQNRGLQQAFRVSGYPTIWVFYLDKDDTGQFTIDPLGKTGYTKLCSYL